MTIRFEWDEEKNQSNIKKHGISFEEAVVVFDDPHLVTFPDRTHGIEQRWKSIGMIGGVVFVLAVHTIREEGSDEVMRIISARYAERPERRLYEEGDDR